MSCSFTETLCDPNGEVVFVTGVINDSTGTLTNVHYTKTDGSPYTGSPSDLRQCGAPVSGIGDIEVGEGSLLPIDNSLYELFRLENHPTMPNGLYWWSESANQWVES